MSPDAPGVKDLRTAYQTLVRDLTGGPVDWSLAEKALLAALPWHAAGEWPNALRLRARIEYAFVVLRRAGCKPWELSSDDLNLFAERLDGLDWDYDHTLTDEVRAELERGSGYGQLIREHIELCDKILRQREAQLVPSTDWRGQRPAKQSTAQPVQRREGEPNGNQYVLAHAYGAERLEAGSIGIRCAKCTNHVIPLPRCTNCGGVLFLPGTDPVLRVMSLVCMGCRNGITSVDCVCGCNNLIGADTIMWRQAQSKGCFVATATCEDASVPEVIELQNFRDRFRLNYRAGRVAIDVYYLASPAIASRIARSRMLRRLAKSLVVRPAACFARALWKLLEKPSFRRGVGTSD